MHRHSLIQPQIPPRKKLRKPDDQLKSSLVRGRKSGRPLDIVVDLHTAVVVVAGPVDLVVLVPSEAPEAVGAGAMEHEASVSGPKVWMERQR
jgi:hypothetical protein